MYCGENEGRSTFRRYCLGGRMPRWMRKIWLEPDNDHNDHHSGRHHNNDKHDNDDHSGDNYRNHGATRQVPFCRHNGDIGGSSSDVQ